MGCWAHSRNTQVCSWHALKFHQSWLTSVRIMQSYNGKIDLLKQEYQCFGHSLRAESLYRQWGQQVPICDPKTNPHKWVDGWMGSLSWDPNLWSYTRIHRSGQMDEWPLIWDPFADAHRFSSVGYSTNLQVWGHFDQVTAVPLSMCTDRRQWSTVSGASEWPLASRMCHHSPVRQSIH